MAITLRDLIETLEDMAEEHGGGTEVRLAIQPRWAFEHSIDEVVAVTINEDGQKIPMVYIGEGRQVGYLSGKASVALGWSEEGDDEDEDDLEALEGGGR